MDIEKLSKLSFFMVERYEHCDMHICDFRKIPRPHFCIGLLLEGEASFTSNDGKTINISAGDIIFVPIASTYVSKWSGSPNVRYITIHFAFEHGCGLSENNNYILQKINLPDFLQLKKDFIFSYENYKSDEYKKMGVLAIFYNLLEKIIPLLGRDSSEPIDPRIEKVKEYINLNSEKHMTICELAQIGMMSTSNLHLLFKQYTGMSPIEYKNHVVISRAMRLLKSSTQSSIEEISDMLGFESSVYFRRVFKLYTGKTPREYRSSNGEI